MTRRRWIADEFSARSAALIGAHAAHLARTLRARVGQEFEVACGENVHRATVTSMADDRVEFALGDEISAGAVVPVTLLLAVFKFDRMEWAIEKCTELNVTTIVPVIARRTEKHLAQAAEKRVERWRRVAREAAEQSRRMAPPEITAPAKLKDALAQSASSNSSVAIPTEGFRPSEGIFCSHAHSSYDKGSLNVSHGAGRPTEPRSGETEVSPGREPGVGSQKEGLSPAGTAQNLNLVLAETERGLMLADVLRAHAGIRSLTLGIGPEGGWTPEELQTFTAAEFLSCSLGDTILRAETAAIAALAIARAEI